MEKITGEKKMEENRNNNFRIIDEQYKKSIDYFFSCVRQDLKRLKNYEDEVTKR